MTWSDPAPAVAPAPRRGRGLVALAVGLAVLLVAGAAGAWWWGQRTLEAGQGWREVALAEAERAERAESAAEAAEAEVERLRGRVAASEADVAGLEQRLDALASEKAGAEDSAALATEVVDDLASLSRRGAEVGAALRDCIAQTTALTNDALAAGPDGLEPERTNERIAEVNTRCGAAEADYFDLLGDLDAVGR